MAPRLTRRVAALGSIAVACLIAGHGPAGAAGVPTSGSLEEIVVEERRIGLVGVARSASEGVVPGVQLEGRPVLRSGEVLEVVPGLIVTQHSGDGKANQYFLRGFNLDHGTDFATRVDGVPVNMPTHAHGQGYTDVNFLIPELIEEVRYRKGTYYADQGNFSAAGSVDLEYRRTVPAPVASLTVGEDNYYRGLLAGSAGPGGGSLLAAVDYSSGRPLGPRAGFPQPERPGQVHPRRRRARLRRPPTRSTTVSISSPSSRTRSTRRTATSSSSSIRAGSQARASRATFQRH